MTNLRISVVATVLAAIAGLACGSRGTTPEDTGTTRQQESANEPPKAGPPLKEAKLIIEHNATDEDTGFQGFVDGEPWNNLVIRDPSDRPIVSVEASSSLRDFGLTELFFETHEPENAEVPIPEVLARLPEGDYSFIASSPEGETMRGNAKFSHVIPAGPEIQSPIEGEQTGTSGVVVSWKPVTKSIAGAPVTIAAYQVIVTNENPAGPTPGFFKEQFSVHLLPSATRVEIPAQFLRPGVDYAVEVFAIEARGNQTFTLVNFTADKNGNGNGNGTRTE